jgi:predicted MFS family arabinose efflux permease
LPHYLKFLLRHRVILAFGLLTVFWGNVGQSFFISWYGAAIQSSLNLSATAYGTAYSAATLVAGFMLMAIGGWIDHLPLRRFVTLIALGLTAACLTLSFANNVLWLLAGFFLLRLFGQSLFPHTGITAMAKHFDKDRGKAISIAGSGVPLGEIGLPILAVWLIAWLGWQQSWRIIAFSVPLIYLPIAWWLLKRVQTNYATIPDPLLTPEHIAPAKLSGGRREMLHDFRFWRLLPAALAAPFILTGIFIHQGFIAAQKGWSPVLLAACFVAYGITHWSGSLIAGVLIDRWRAVRILPFFLLPLATGMLVCAFQSGAWTAAVLMISLGITIGFSGPIFTALWAEVYGTAKLGAIRSLVVALMVLASSLSPALFGYLIDHGTSATQLLTGMGIYAALAAILVLFSYRHNAA